MIGLNFVAIDFETANNYRKSACSLGLVVVRDGEIVDSKYWLIKPEPLEVGFYQKKVHGLSLEDLVDKPSFHELWPEIAPYFENQILVCHNAGFDISVLSHLMAHYEMEFNDYDYFCTMSGARQAFPKETSYGLSYLAFKHGIDFVHHQALEDARACAKLAVIMAKHLEINSLTDFHKRIWQIERQNRKKPVTIEESPKLPIDETHPFYQKQIVFTGTLQRLVRSDAKVLVESVGGIFADTLTKATNYLVVGSWNPSFGDSEKSSKMVKAEKFIEAGSDLQVIDETYFMELFVS